MQIFMWLTLRIRSAHLIPIVHVCRMLQSTLAHLWADCKVIRNNTVCKGGSPLLLQWHLPICLSWIMLQLCTTVMNQPYKQGMLQTMQARFRAWWELGNVTNLLLPSSFSGALVTFVRILPDSLTNWCWWSKRILWAAGISKPLLSVTLILSLLNFHCWKSIYLHLIYTLINNIKADAKKKI